MAAERLILMLASVLLVAVGAHASPEQGDERVGEYLRAHQMTPLLEAQLEDRIARADEAEQIEDLARQLSDLYLTQLRQLSPADAYRQVVLIRARALVERMTSVPMYELRLELIIDRYTRVEPDVELSRLGLLGDEPRAKAIARLVEIERELGILVAKLEPELAQATRRVSRAGDKPSPQEIGDLRRFSSLTHYYHGWAGYSIAVLRGMHAPQDVFVSFGWLLGAEGSTPKLDELSGAVLQYEHVARAAIGVALAYAQSGDDRTGRVWATKVVESEQVSPQIRDTARQRLLQIYIMGRSWHNANLTAREVMRAQGGSLPVADARLLAMGALSALGSGPIGEGGRSEAEKVIRLAIEQLVEQGEIGHVVDLYQRFDSIPVLQGGFIPQYARALAQLERAQQDGASPMYASIASSFAQALKAQDARDYPEHREDCTLKLAYAEILAGRPQEAIAHCTRIIDSSLREQAIEEARWMRIAAYDQLNEATGVASSAALEEAVREYIIAYPSSDRSARLVLKHALQGTIDPRVALHTLEAVGDDDPIAIPARRALVQLYYQQLREGSYSDDELSRRAIELVEWIIAAQSEPVTEPGEARVRLNTLRIGLDLVMRQRPLEVNLAEALIGRAQALLDADPTLAIYRGEMLYRRIELALARDRLDPALTLLGQLDAVDAPKAQNARVLLLNTLMRRWREGPSVDTARRITSIGAPVLARMTPARPKTLGVQVSAIAELIADAAGLLWERTNDQPSLALAMRVSVMVLERGQPSAEGLRRTAALAAASGDQQNELRAWLRLLAAYPEGEASWYEARYQSLRAMQAIDPPRAFDTFVQYRTLHPGLGPEPWGAKIAALFGVQTPDAESVNSGGAP